MTAFSKTRTHVNGTGEIHMYVGMPDCGAFYSWVHGKLEELIHQGVAPPSPPLTELTTGQKGNYGEAITYLVGRTERFNTPHHFASLGGALTVLNPSAPTGVDILIVFLDPNGIVANDRLFIQEIKTTGSEGLAYSTALIEDYEKLLGTVKPSMSLMARVSSLKCKLAWEHNYTQELLQRVEDLAQPLPINCTRIHLLPTLVHDRGSNPIAALSHVMAEINRQGWPQGTVEAWSISITQLNNALIRLANRVASIS
jgi:hypothetical protein